MEKPNFLKVWEETIEKRQTYKEEVKKRYNELGIKSIELESKVNDLRIKWLKNPERYKAYKKATEELQELKKELNDMELIVQEINKVEEPGIEYDVKKANKEMKDLFDKGEARLSEIYNEMESLMVRLIELKKEANELKNTYGAYANKASLISEKGGANDFDIELYGYSKVWSLIVDSVIKLKDGIHYVF